MNECELWTRERFLRIIKKQKKGRLWEYGIPSESVIFRQMEGPMFCAHYSRRLNFNTPYILNMFYSILGATYHKNFLKPILWNSLRCMSIMMISGSIGWLYLITLENIHGPFTQMTRSNLVSTHSSHVRVLAPRMCRFFLFGCADFYSLHLCGFSLLACVSFTPCMCSHVWALFSVCAFSPSSHLLFSSLLTCVQVLSPNMCRVFTPYMY